MRAVKWTVLGLLVAAGVTFAEPGTQPTTQAAKKVRLVQPWSKVTDLSEDQKDQLAAIHTEVVDRMNALRDEERERCMSVLTEEQKAALEATLAREAAERKARSAERRTSKPAPADKN